MHLEGLAEGPRAIFSETIFTRRAFVAKPPYIRAPHPKTGILPELSSIKRILEQGWVGQTKIHGHRCQLHISADEEIVVYNRQGKPHAKIIEGSMLKEVVRLFKPKKGWNVIDSEWLKPAEKLYVFDFLKEEDVLLNKLPYPARYEKLPRRYISPHVQTLPLIKDLNGCLKILESDDPLIEGLVFKSLTRTGFADTSIIRCRKRANS